MLPFPGATSFTTTPCHAPWCPACKDLQKAWNAFADWSNDLNIKVGEVDVTVNPGLSGRFLVTALPTIYHVKDGVFRVYSGPRDKNDFITFIEDKRWRSIDAVPDYKHPNSKQMAVVAVFFKLSMAVRDLHNHLVEVKGIPSWASYSLFAGVTLALGCILGFFIVLIIDQVFPTGSKKGVVQSKKDPKKDSNGATKKVIQHASGFTKSLSVEIFLDFWSRLSLMIANSSIPAEEAKKRESNSPKPETKKTK
uniref:Thioredoxin domain-containing protein n=1 Tax=Angiostrongylus cantonensis TaxID=6313 RepID=A0A158P6P0_ANGCA